MSDRKRQPARREPDPTRVQRSADIFSGEPGSRRTAADITRRGVSFNMRTNMKDRPGSQGTLFQGGKPVAEHRWPRGYSPIRMAEVSGALHQQGGGTSSTFDKKDVLDPEYEGIQHPHLNPFSDAHTSRMMLEPIARSTLPVSTVGSLSGGLHLRVMASTPMGEAAHYEPHGRTINVNRQPWLSTPDPRQKMAKADATLIHEMGHHEDMSANMPAYNAMSAHHPWGFEGIRGMLEANADRSMLHHFRNDPRNQRRTNFDPRTETYGGRGHAEVAGAGYEDPGAATLEGRKEARKTRVAEAHQKRTGEVLTRSPLHPGQFKFDRQQVLF